MVRQMAKGVKLYDTPIKAIRQKCLDCTCDQYEEIRKCTVINCALYPYRMGRRPDEVTLLSLKEYYGVNDEPTDELLTKTGTIEVEV